jgi:hypothetical protein
MLADEAKILGAVSGCAHGSFRLVALLAKIVFSGQSSLDGPRTRSCGLGRVI